MNTLGKTMRGLLISALMLAMTLPAFAQQATRRASAETVVILGYAIPTPVQVDEPVEWATVQPYVPAALYDKPAAPMTSREIYNEINRLMSAKMDEYERALSALAIARAGEYPDVPREEVEMMLADQFVTGEGEGISSDVQRLAHEYAALLYLHGAFETELRAQGYEPTRYAPGPVPER